MHEFMAPLVWRHVFALYGFSSVHSSHVSFPILRHSRTLFIVPVASRSFGLFRSSRHDLLLTAYCPTSMTCEKRHEYISNTTSLPFHNSLFASPHRPIPTSLRTLIDTNPHAIPNPCKTTTPQPFLLLQYSKNVP